MDAPPPPTDPLPPVLFSFPTAEETGSKLAEFVIKAQTDAIPKRGKFTVAISGGSLPKVLATGLVGRSDVQWDKWEIFFADERLVPLSSPDSNYNVLKTELLDKLPTPLRPEQVHTIAEDLIKDPAEAADNYEKQLVEIFAGKAAVAFPRFDLILLGTGPDGHTCSLFPGHPLLSEELRWVAELEDSPKPPPVRITLTYPVLDHAYNICFVVTGSGKKEIVERVFEKNGKTEELLPCERVRPARPGCVYWFTDVAASEGARTRIAEFKL